MPEPILMFRSPRRPSVALEHRDEADFAVRRDPEDVIPDHTSLAGAEALARRIRAYWRLRGHEIDIRLVTTSNGRDTIAHIRSDMVGGLPRRRG